MSDEEHPHGNADQCEYPRGQKRWLMINGAHIMLYTSDAETDRRFIRHCPDGLGYRPEPCSATASQSIGAHG